MKTIFVRSEYNYDMKQASDESAKPMMDEMKKDGAGRTQQHFKDEVDINTIVERFGLTGELPTVVRLPAYTDYEGVFDFLTAQNKIREATEAFMELPAKIRARFDNSEQKFLEFCADPDNTDEAIKLGLVTKPEPAPEPQPEPAKPAPDPKT